MLGVFSFIDLFHFPVKRRVRNRLPRNVSSMAIASQTPFSPYSLDNHAARVSRTPHIAERLMMAGFSVSPAPTKTPLQTMAAANIGSAHASMRNTRVPSSITSSTGDIRLISSGANIHIIMPMTVITMMPSDTDSWAKLRVSIFCPAPIP